MNCSCITLPDKFEIDLFIILSNENRGYPFIVFISFLNFIISLFFKNSKVFKYFSRIHLFRTRYRDMHDDGASEPLSSFITTTTTITTTSDEVEV